MPYEFDRYVGRRLMAQGARIERAASEDEALEKARELFEADANPGEMARTTFVLTNREARMSDIVERLRNPKYDCAEEAADEIERLRAALGKAADRFEYLAPEYAEETRAALGGKGE